MVLCSFVQLVGWMELVCIICGFARTLGRLTVLLFLVGWLVHESLLQNTRNDLRHNTKGDRWEYIYVRLESPARGIAYTKCS